MTRRLLLVLLLWIPFGAYLAGFWPGVMTFDSLSQWAQAVGRLPWTDVHPALSTAGFWIAAQLGSPAVLAAAQSVFLAWAIVSFLVAIAGLGARPAAVIVAGAAVFLAPSVGLFSVTLWKDVPFTAAVLLLGANVLRMMSVRLRLTGDDTPGAQAIALRALFARAAAWGVLATLLRQNGVVVAALVMVAVAVAFPRLRRRAVAAAALFPLGFLLVRYAILPGLGVTPAKQSVVQATLAHEVAAYVRHQPAALSAEDWAIVESIGPREAWAVGYDCRSVHPLLDGGGLRMGAVDQFPEVLPRLWRTLISRAPGTAVRHRICASELAWHPFGVANTWFFTGGRAIERNIFGLKSAPLHDGLDELLNEAVSLTELAGLRPFFWRAPIWIGLALIVLTREAIRRRRPLWLVPAAPLVAQQVAIVLANPGQDARYMAAAGIAAVLLLPLATREGMEASVRSTYVNPEEPKPRRPWRPGETQAPQARAAERSEAEVRGPRGAPGEKLPTEGRRLIERGAWRPGTPPAEPEWPASGDSP